MELKPNNQEQKPVSVLQGDGYRISRILARESSFGQSSRIFYRAAEGVPFRWEMQPGTPMNPQEEDVIPPPSPSPLMQSMGLPLPNLDHDENKESALKTSKIWRLRKILKKRISSSILEEGSTRIYYCSQHKTAFAVKEDGLYLSRILSRVSAAEQISDPLHTETPPAGIPFRWEMQAGTPKNPPENELIPPPSPPPALQILSLPRPRLHNGGEKAKKSTWKKAWFWIRCYDKKKETGKMKHEISFRYNKNMEICSSDEEFDASFRESGSVSSLSSVSRLSKGAWRVSKIRRNFKGSYLSCGPWSRRDIVVFGRKKLKPFTS